MAILSKTFEQIITEAMERVLDRAPIINASLNI